jgi:hypothetical protein
MRCQTRVILRKTKADCYTDMINDQRVGDLQLLRSARRRKKQNEKQVCGISIPLCTPPRPTIMLARALYIIIIINSVQHMCTSEIHRMLNMDPTTTDFTEPLVM